VHGDVVEVAHHEHGPALERYSSESRQNHRTGLCRGKCLLGVRLAIFEVHESARHLASPSPAVGRCHTKCDTKKPGPERMGWVVVGPPPVQDEEDVMHEIFDVGAWSAEAPEGAAQVVELLLERSETIPGGSYLGPRDTPGPQMIVRHDS
jgi:hypothetical protein